MSTNLILAGHTLDWETKFNLIVTFIHELGSDFKIVENYRLINPALRNGSKFYGNFSDDTEIALMAQNKLVHVWTWAYSWRFLLSLESAYWSGDFNTHNNIINISIFIFFHARSSSTDPASQRGELDWVWLMPTDYTKLGELFFHIFPNNSGLNTGHHIVFIDPFNFIHSGTINRNNCSFLALLAHQTFSNICSSE